MKWTAQEVVSLCAALARASSDSPSLPVRERATRPRDPVHATLPLHALNPLDDSDSSQGAVCRRRGRASRSLSHTLPAYATASEAMLQSIVDECCAKAAASGRLRCITEYSKIPNPSDDKDFLSQCAALSEALSRTSESSSVVTPSRTSSSRPPRASSGSLTPTAAMQLQSTSTCHRKAAGKVVAASSHTRTR